VVGTLHAFPRGSYLRNLQTVGGKWLRPVPWCSDYCFEYGYPYFCLCRPLGFYIGAIYHFVEPRLCQAKFYVIGDKAPPEVIALASETVIITGLQPDIRPYFDSVELSIAPLRFGAGVKGKVNQSMGFGVPVVATSIGVAGMSLMDREDILIADNPNDFAQALIELDESEELWNRVSENVTEKTRALYSSEVAQEQLSSSLQRRSHSAFRSREQF